MPKPFGSVIVGIIAVAGFGSTTARSQQSSGRTKARHPNERKHGALAHPSPRAGYAAMVTRMDRSVGRIAAMVRELGLDNDTVMLLTSDNGPIYDRAGGSDGDFCH